jgi:hypothetical protein
MLLLGRGHILSFKEAVAEVFDSLDSSRVSQDFCVLPKHKNDHSAE